MAKTQAKTSRKHPRAAKAQPKVEVRCAFCGGHGRDPFGLLSDISECPVCLGRGVVEMVEPYVRCAYCDGTGVHPGSRLTCSSCGGRGFQTVKEPHETCPQCGGSGDDGTERHLSCLYCHGAGVVHVHRAA